MYSMFQRKDVINHMKFLFRDLFLYVDKCKVYMYLYCVITNIIKEKNFKKIVFKTYVRFN